MSSPHLDPGSTGSTGTRLGLSNLTPSDLTTVPSLTRRPGRIFKNPTRSSSSRSSRSRSGPYDRPSNSPRPQSHTLPTPKTRTLSMLEALPTEIIELIFLHSLNLNFPRASPFLSRALSGEHIYRTLILLAFWHDPPGYPGSVAIDRMMAGPLEYVPLSLDARERLQEDILKCRWSTSERVGEQVPTMQILTIHRHWINAGVVVDKSQQTMFDQFLDRQIDPPHEFIGQGPPMPTLFNAEQMLDAIAEGPQTYDLEVTPMVSTRILPWDAGRQVILPALNLIKFPDYLLRGRRNGFLPEDIALLEMLRITSYNWTYFGNIRVTSTKVNRKALNEGIQKAIRTQNLDALVCLLKIDQFIFRDGAEFKVGALYTIPEEHFLAVTRIARDKPELNLAFFEALLRASAESMPNWSSELTEWIVDHVALAKRNPNSYKDINGRFVNWLLSWKMRLPELPEQMHCPHRRIVSNIFCHGALNSRSIEGIRFFDEVLYPDGQPHTEWLVQSSFSVEGRWIKESGTSLS